jgi:hypothetical protein
MFKKIVQDGFEIVCLDWIMTRWLLQHLPSRLMGRKISGSSL